MARAAFDPVRAVQGALEEIRAEVIAAGGDVKLVDVAGRVVQVTLAGAFTRSCQSKRTVLKRLEKSLQARCPWVERLEAVCPPPERRAR